jgi:hypothetical protein
LAFITTFSLQSSLLVIIWLSLLPDHKKLRGRFKYILFSGVSSLHLALSKSSIGKKNLHLKKGMEKLFFQMTETTCKNSNILGFGG